MTGAFDNVAFDPATFDCELWGVSTMQPETWTSEQPAMRIFDPNVFDRSPIFDTGPIAGIWNEKSRQSEIWTGI